MGDSEGGGKNPLRAVHPVEGGGAAEAVEGGAGGGAHVAAVEDLKKGDVAH